MCSFVRFFLKWKWIFNIENLTIVYRLMPSGLIGWFGGYERRENLFKVFLLVKSTGWNAEIFEVRGRLVLNNKTTLNRRKLIRECFICFLCLIIKRKWTQASVICSSSYLDSLNYPITIIIIIVFFSSFSSRTLVWWRWWQQLN